MTGMPYDTHSEVPWYEQDAYLAQLYRSLMENIPEADRPRATSTLSMIAGYVHGWADRERARVETERTKASVEVMHRHIAQATGTLAAMAKGLRELEEEPVPQGVFDAIDRAAEAGQEAMDALLWRRRGTDARRDPA